MFEKGNQIQVVYKVIDAAIKSTTVCSIKQTLGYHNTNYYETNQVPL